jgi:(p)ppGpp synthase/HD superfamily hydrolase
VGAKVNGRMVPLRHKLHSGDIVEILTQPGHKPSRDWLAIVKSSRSRNKIKHWLNLHQQERAIEIGKKLIEKEARKYRMSLKQLKDADLLRAAGEYGLGRADDLGWPPSATESIQPAKSWPNQRPPAANHCRRGKNNPRAGSRALSAAFLVATTMPS